MRIDLDHICLAAKGTPLLRDVCACVSHGAFVSILGESGAGKTTLLRVASGLAVQDSGRVLFDGRAVDDLPANRRGVAMVFQDARLFPNMSVLDNVAFPLKVRGVGRTHRREQAARMLEKVQLAGLGERRTHEISGGQRQRVALARALVAAPGAVLMDEPFSALDESLRDDMRELVLSLHADLGLTVLMVTHDPVEAVTMSDQVIYMAGGAVEQAGTGADILLRPATAHVRSCFKDTVAIEGEVEESEEGAASELGETGGADGAGQTGEQGKTGHAGGAGHAGKQGKAGGPHKPACMPAPHVFRARRLSVPTDAPCGPALLVRTRAGATSVKPLGNRLRGCAMPQVEAAQAASEIETLQEYLDTCEGVRRALGITGATPQLHPLAQGECNVNYWFDAPERALAQLEARGGARSDRLILRVNHVSQMHLSNQIAYEFGALDALEACGRTPRTLWCDASCRLVPWGVGVEEFLPGRPLVYETDLAQAARILADVHALDVPEAARATLVCPENPLLAIAQECREMFETYRAWARADQHVLARVDAMMARAFALAEGEGEAAHTTGAARATGATGTRDAQAAGASGAAKTGAGAAGAAGEAACAGAAGGATRRRCIVNTELNSRNFLIGPTDEASYLVDWEKPLLSVPEQDLAHFLVPTTTNWKTDTVLTRAQRDSFLAAYEQAVAGRFPTEGLRERLDAFLTVTCLRGITWCAMACVGYTEGDAALRNADTFAKIQQFLSPAYLEMIWEEFYR